MSSISWRISEAEQLENTAGGDQSLGGSSLNSDIDVIDFDTHKDGHSKNLLAVHLAATQN